MFSTIGENVAIMHRSAWGSFFPSSFDGLDHPSVCVQRSASTFPPLDFPAELTGGARGRWMRNTLGPSLFPWASNTRVESDTDRVVWSPTCFLEIFYFSYIAYYSAVALLIDTLVHFNFEKSAFGRENQCRERHHACSYLSYREED